MPRYRGTTEGTASLVGRLLILIASGRETSVSLADELGVSPRTVNRYILQLIDAGWDIERVGVPTHQDYWIKLKSPRIVLKKEREASPEAQTAAQEMVVLLASSEPLPDFTVQTAEGEVLLRKEGDWLEMGGQRLRLAKDGDHGP